VTAGINIETNSTLSDVKTCTTENSIKLVVTQTSDLKLSCVDNTKVGTNYSLGPVCAGGVQIQNFTVPTNFVPCDQVTICGVHAITKKLINSSKYFDIYELIYSGLPWGCEGSIVWGPESTVSSASTLHELPVSVKPSACGSCLSSQVPTCVPCAPDTTAPLVQEVLTDSSDCNMIHVSINAIDQGGGIDPNGYSFDGGLTWQATRDKIFSTVSLSLAGSQIKVKDRSGNIASYNKTVSATSAGCSCTLPWAKKITSGSSVYAFKNAQVTCGSSCSASANREARGCNNGVLSGSFANETCTAIGCKACTLPWGESLNTGSTIKGFDVSAPACQSDCSQSTHFVTYSCNDGKLLCSIANAAAVDCPVNTAAAYNNKTCVGTHSNCNCSVTTTSGNVPIVNGTSVTLYTQGTFGCMDNPQTMTANIGCSLGTLSGVMSGTTYFSSIQSGCNYCVAGGALFAVGASPLKVYKQNSSTCDNPIKCEDAANWLKIGCSDPQGNIRSIIEGVPAANIDDFQYTSCNQIPCKCRFDGLDKDGVTTFREFSAGTFITVYKVGTAVSPDSCDLPSNQSQVVCHADLTKSGPTDSTFKYTQCVQSSGGTQAGGSSSNVGAGQGGGVGGGIGNDQGDGEGFRRRKKGGGDGCSPSSPPYICGGPSVNINLRLSVTDGDTTFCLLPGLDGYDRAENGTTRKTIVDITTGSSVPDGNLYFTQRVSPSGFIPAFSEKIAPSGHHCSEYMGLIKCTEGGTMSQQDKYKFLDCSEGQ
jgi:hypothetical protein